MNKARPYRSRRIPACRRCRARRTKCAIETIGKACILCRKDGEECSAVMSTTLRSRHHADISVITSGVSQSAADLHIVAPMIARDTRVLEELLPTGNAHTLPSSSARLQHQQPVFHVPIPPRRLSPARCACSQDFPLTLARAVRPFLDQLIQLYVEHLHSCLPLFDTESLASQLASEGQMSQILLVNFEAYTLSYWDLSPSLSKYSRPDQDFAWQAACSVMDANIQKGGILAIVCAILNVGGRPSKSVVHNMTNVARMVALSHSIGLNHDSSDWQISDVEKRMRQRVWWAVLIHDRWFHFAQGTPPMINAEQYNVPLPTIGQLTNFDDLSTNITLSARCYIALCQLTEVIGDILPLVYHVRSGSLETVHEQLSRSQARLEEWFKSSSTCFNPEQPIDTASSAGLVNLQLAYLSTNMLLKRLCWHEKLRSEFKDDEYLLSESQRAARKIVDFAVSLKPCELAGFWLPYSAQHFTSAVSLLLGCALKTAHNEIMMNCVDDARILVSCLRDHRDRQMWDMAETALIQSETILNRVEEALPTLRQTKLNGTGSKIAAVIPGDRMHASGGNQLGNSTHDFHDTLGMTSLEDLFPEAFSIFGDHTLFDQIWLQDDANSLIG